MTGLDYFTFVVLTLLCAAGLALAYVVGSLPGKVAMQRGHPQADAIRVMGWLGLLAMGLFFPFALIWAYTRPSSESDVETLRGEIDRRLEQGVPATLLAMHWWLYSKVLPKVKKPR